MLQHNQTKLSKKDFPELTKKRQQPVLDNSPEKYSTQEGLSSRSLSSMQKISYLDQIKKENSIPKENKYHTPEGWTTLQQVKGRNQVIITRNIKEEKEDPYAVLNALVNLDKKRKQKYLETWGEDNYDKEFPKYEPIYYYSEESDVETETSDIVGEDIDMY
jgi:hypothetical protein